MKESFLTRVSWLLSKRTEEAYLSGDKEAALYWSKKLDKVIYQLLLIKNREILDGLKTGTEHS